MDIPTGKPLDRTRFTEHNDRTALSLAKRNGHAEVVELLED